MAYAVSLPQKVIESSNQDSSGHQGKYSDTGLLFKLSDRALVVCRIILGNSQGSATGFLIGKDLIMTNNHVLNSLEAARTSKACFFYTKDSEGVEVALNPDNFFYSSPSPDLLGFNPVTNGKFDFTIVSIHSHPKITEVSHLAFSIFCMTIPKKEINANIIHHPLDPDGTSYQKVSFRENLVKEISLYTIHYTTTTLPGSSGSPVIDDEGNLIALHRATCTHILKALLNAKMLISLLQELFPDIPFVKQTLTLMNPQSKEKREFKGLCAPIQDSPLYIFSEGELKGQYFHQGKIASLFRLIQTKHFSPKKWALEFLNSRLEEPLAEHHKECNTAVPIKAIHDHLKSVNLLDQIYTRYQRSQKTLCNLLKDSYLQHYALLPLVLTNEAFPITSFFTQLSIVSHRSQEKKEKALISRDLNLVEKDSLSEIYTRLNTIEKSIEINTLFDDQESKSVNKILILGRAGIGKSTLCQKIAYDWASGSLFREKFNLVFHFKILILNSLIRKYPLAHSDPDKWLSKIIAETFYEGLYQEKIFQEFQRNPDKILLIFDGWDEASLELTEALKTYFLQTKITHHLLTSRPGVTHEIDGSFDLIVENMGFTNDQIITYANKFFSHTKCKDLDPFLKTLRARSTLFAIAHIPIQLQILCALWKEGVKSFPQTLTPLFSKIVHRLFDWEQKKKDPKEDFASLKQAFIYQALGAGALKGLENRLLIIPKQLIDETLKERSLEDPIFREMKIKRQDLISTGLVKECGENGEIYFLHLTYQEYSIAKYISSLPANCPAKYKKHAEEQQRAFVVTYRHTPHFHLVIQMLAGCIWEDAHQKIKALETFFEWLYDGVETLFNPSQMELVLSCLNECPSEELEKRIWERYKIALSVDFALKEERQDGLVRLAEISKRVAVQIIEYLEKNDFQRQLPWFFFLLGKCLKNEETILRVLNLFQRALNVKNSEVRQDALRALEYLIERIKKEDAIINEETIPHFLHFFQTALSNEDSQVCRAAVHYTTVLLAGHIKGEAIPQILSFFQLPLNAKNSEVRQDALRALEYLIERIKKEDAIINEETIPHFINFFQTALSNEDSQVCRAAVHYTTVLLAGHIKGEAIPQILSFFQLPLNAKNSEVRQEAIRALEYLIERIKKEDAIINEETIPHFINFFQTALSNEDPQVCRAAVHYTTVLLAGHIKGEAIPQILSFFQLALNAKNSEVRQEAIQAYRYLKNSVRLHTS